MARFAIGDIHGCSKTFKSLLRKISFSKEDELFLLGDYVNKGPDSKGVLDQILEFKKYKFQIHCIRGNHDQILLDATQSNRNDDWIIQSEKALTLKSFNIESPEKLREDYIAFLKSLPYYIETEDFLFVHSSFNFSSPDIFADKEAMLTGKLVNVDLQKTGGKKIVHGHRPSTVTTINENIYSDGPTINVDSGCVYYKNEGLGNLVALNLDTYDLICQANIDQPYDVKIR